MDDEHPLVKNVTTGAVIFAAIAGYSLTPLLPYTDAGAVAGLGFGLAVGLGALVIELRGKHSTWWLAAFGVIALASIVAQGNDNVQFPKRATQAPVK